MKGERHLNRVVMAALMIMAAALILTVLSGCAAQPDSTEAQYQVGDITTAALERQDQYCAETDPVRRAVLLALLRSQVPDYPASGLCTDRLLIADKIAKEAGPLPDVDIEQAIKDQEAAKERQQLE